MCTKKYLTLILSMLFCIFAVTALAADAQIITKDEAVKTALTVAGGTLVKAKLDTENRILVYEIEILDPANVLHRIDINAVDGSVVRHRQDQRRGKTLAQLHTAELTHADAAAIANEKLPGSTAVESSLLLRRNTPVFELDVVDSQGIEHEIIINAIDGSIVSMRQDEVFRTSPTITREQAETAALAVRPGSVLYTKLDRDGGSLYYEVYIVFNAQIYEVKVDAQTGRAVRTKVKD